MDLLAWIILVLCTVIGLVGMFIPGIPGMPIIFIGALAHKLILPQVLSWWTIFFLAVCVLIGVAIDLLSTAVGAKWGGAGKWGLGGALAGGLIGLFFGLPGIILGPLAGAFLAERVFAKRKTKEAARASLGAGAGLVMALVLRLGLALVVVVWLWIDCSSSSAITSP